MGCGDDNASSAPSDLGTKISTVSRSGAANTELTLYSNQDTFTIPSTFSIESTNESYQCLSATLVTDSLSIDIPITPGLKLTESNRLICSLGNLPKKTQEPASLTISYRETDSNLKTIQTLTEDYNNISPTLNDIGAVPVKIFNSPGEFNNITYPTSDFIPSVFDYSGAASSTAHILENKHGMSFTEREVMEGLLEHGDIEKIQERRGFSLLDINNFSEALGISTHGYKIPLEANGKYSEDDINSLKDSTPFLTAILMNGYEGFFVVSKITNENITLIHPHFGFIQVSMEQLESKELFSHGDWIALVFE